MNMCLVAIDIVLMIACTLDLQVGLGHVQTHVFPTIAVTNKELDVKGKNCFKGRLAKTIFSFCYLAPHPLLLGARLPLSLFSLF